MTTTLHTPQDAKPQQTAANTTNTNALQGSLRVSDLHVAFGDFVAIDRLDIEFRPGEVHFLIGPNGAGKTTLVDAITGLAPAQGRIMLGETELSGLAVHRIARLGIGRTFQTASVFEELTVLQNLDIAAGSQRSIRQLLRRRQTVPAVVNEALETVGLTRLADTPAGALSHGQKQWLEIGMLLVQDAQVLLLDEPVAGMSAAEREATGALLQRIAKTRAVVVVEHDMSFVREYATTITVLAQGAILARGNAAEIHANPEVQEVYLGSAATSATPAEEKHHG